MRRHREYFVCELAEFLRECVDGEEVGTLPAVD